MRLTFYPDPETGCRCTGGDAGVTFSLSQDSAFQNRDYHFWEDSFLFDGYSHWFRGKRNCLPEGECFTISLNFLPITYSAHGDGLFTYYSAKENKGIEIILEQGGIVTVNLGIDRAPIRFSSIRAHAQAGVRNVVTVVYRGDAGWCDLYVNGVFSNRKQFRRHTAYFPRGLSLYRQTDRRQLLYRGGSLRLLLWISAMGRTGRLRKKRGRNSLPPPRGIHGRNG